jgi:hypothetical protein
MVVRKIGGRMGKDGGELVAATEIAAYVYCPEQWRLQYGLGIEPRNRKALKAGTRHHVRKAMMERIAGGAIVAGGLIVIAAVLLLWSVWR